jgi:BolA protein
MKQRILDKLSSLNPSFIEIIDESDQHKGHAGYKNGETHFRLIIRADIFKNKNKVETHRIIYNLLAQELKEQIHALAIDAKAND